MAKKSSGPRIFWRNGRANADFRTDADVGGSREALAEPRRSWSTIFEARRSQEFWLALEPRLPRHPLREGCVSQESLEVTADGIAASAGSAPCRMTTRARLSGSGWSSSSPAGIPPTVSM